MQGQLRAIFISVAMWFWLYCLPALASESASVQAQIKEGDELLSADRFELAVGVYRQAVAEVPGNAEAHQRLGKALSLTGNLAAAEQELRVAVQLDPDDALAHSTLGMILGMQKRYAESVVEERTAIELDPGDAFAYRLMGAALCGLGLYDDAIRAFHKAIEIEPYNSNAYLNLGATLGRQGDFINASEAYGNVLKLNPNSVAAHIGLGAALGKAGDQYGQVREYRVATTLAPGSDSSHGRLGYALFRTGHWQEAFKEGSIANWIRLRKHGIEYLHASLTLWGSIFLFFGLLFALVMLGLRFKPLLNEQVIKSYFLTFHNDRPGRFIITSKRLVFVPVVFSRLFGTPVISIERCQIATIESKKSGSGGILIIELQDGARHQFQIPMLVMKPLMEAMSENEAPSQGSIDAPTTLAARELSRLHKITQETLIKAENTGKKPGRKARNSQAG